MNNELNLLFVDDLKIFLKNTQGLLKKTRGILKKTPSLLKDNSVWSLIDDNIIKKLEKIHVILENDDDPRSFKESEYFIKEMPPKNTNDDEPELIIRRNKFNNFVFKNTSYIFKSSTEKYIVATEGLNGEWLPLTPEDKIICKKKYKLRCKDLPQSSKTSIDKDVLKQIKLPYEVSVEKTPGVVDKNKIVVNSDDEIEVD